MPNNIAIVGTKGAGKTVFVTVLAKYLSTPKNGVMLIPDSYKIAAYVESNYAKLQRGQWLDQTQVEERLSWKLRGPNNEEQRLTLLDCAGEDIQRLFVNKVFNDEVVGGRDRDLVEYLLTASTVLLLINLQDYLDDSFDEDNVLRKTQREHTLKEFLTAIKKNRTKNIAVIFTAYNQYRQRIESQYSSPTKFLAQELPALYYEHFKGSGLHAFRVSAVAETDEDNCPRPGFSQQGLEPVIEWVVDPVEYDKNRQRDQNPQIHEQKEQKDASGPKMFDW